jgi:hypothetical protein
LSSLVTLLRVNCPLSVHQKHLLGSREGIRCLDLLLLSIKDCYNSKLLRVSASIPGRVTDSSIHECTVEQKLRLRNYVKGRSLKEGQEG